MTRRGVDTAREGDHLTNADLLDLWIEARQQNRGTEYATDLAAIQSVRDAVRRDVIRSLLEVIDQEFPEFYERNHVRLWLQGYLDE